MLITLYCPECGRFLAKIEGIGGDCCLEINCGRCQRNGDEPRKVFAISFQENAVECLHNDLQPQEDAQRGTA